MNNNKKIGKIGEEIAGKYLEENGYQIIERNYYCKLGEIDIIAKQKDIMVFVEVKTRKNINYGSPSEAVNKIKQRHIYNVARYYICINRIKNIQLRFDVIEVIYLNGIFKCNHIKQIM